MPHSYRALLVGQPMQSARHALKHLGFELLYAFDAESCLRLCAAFQPDLVLISDSYGLLEHPIRRILPDSQVWRLSAETAQSFVSQNTPSPARPRI